MNAVAMIAACMTYQTAPVAVVDLGRIPHESIPLGGPSLGQTDAGIEGHAAQAQAYDDVRDDGTPLPVAVTSGEAG